MTVKMRNFAMLSILLLLVACTAPQTHANSQISPTPIPPLTITPFALTGTPVATASPQRPGNLNIRRLQMIDANVGWAEGSITGEHDPTRFSDTYYYLLRTTDGGETWQDVTPPTPFTNTSGRGPGISIYAIDADTAWATPVDVAFSQDPPYTLVWHTSDGGKSWQPGNPITLSIFSEKLSPWLQFVDEKHGWLTFHIQSRIESRDLQYRTSDGGLTWEEINGCYTFDGARRACDVPQFTDPQTGWLENVPEYTSSGDVIPSSIWRVQRTLDGGETWQTISIPPSGEQKYCSQTFTLVNTGIVGMRVDCTTSEDLRESYFYLSADRGQSWNIFPITGREFKLSSPISIYETSGLWTSATGNVFFLNMTTGWRISATDEGYQLEKTAEGGMSWQKQTDHLPWNDGLQFVDDNYGWMAIVDDYSEQPKSELQRTTDGGKTWVKLTPRLLPADPDRPTIARLEAGYPLIFESIRMSDSLNGWAVGTNGYVFHTADGGRAWQDVTPLYGSIINQRELFALDALQAWITVSFPMYQTIWSTTDGGQTWQQSIALSEGQTVSPGSIRFLNENIGWFQLSQGGTTREVRLMKTRDHGIAWEVQSTGQYPHQVVDGMGFMFLDEMNGFRIEPVEEQALDDLLNNTPVLISRTNDGGTTWQAVDLPNMVLDVSELTLDQEAYPGGMQELMKEPLSCREGIALRAFSVETIGMQVLCRGAYRDVGGTYGYVFVLGNYYLSADAGSTWNNWMSFGDDLPRESDHTPLESEFFLPDGIGWRLKANQLLQTTDRGKTWTTLKAVGWEEARLDFINPQEGWGIAKSGHAISLVHTVDGGKTWDEIEPVIAP